MMGEKFVLLKFLNLKLMTSGGKTSETYWSHYRLSSLNLRPLKNSPRNSLLKSLSASHKVWRFDMRNWHGPFGSVKQALCKSREAGIIAKDFHISTKTTPYSLITPHPEPPTPSPSPASTPDRFLDLTYWGPEARMRAIRQTWISVAQEHASSGSNGAQLVVPPRQN